MPALGALLASLLPGLAAFFARLFVAKLAVVTVGVGAVVAVGALLMTTFNAQVAPLVAQLFNHPFGQFIGLAFPPVAGSCVGAIATVWAACTTYSLQRRAITMTTGV